MKKLILLLLTLVMTISLCACGNSNNSSENTEETIKETELTVEELKAIIALKKANDYFYDMLEDPESLSILGLTVVADSEVEGYHMVKIEFSAANKVGGRVRDEIYIFTNRDEVTINTEYFSDNLIEREASKGENKEEYNKFVDDGMDEVKVDVDKVIDNLDLTEDELTKISSDIYGISK